MLVLMENQTNLLSVPSSVFFWVQQWKKDAQRLIQKWNLPTLQQKAALLPGLSRFGERLLDAVGV
jgi:hypothetical protein